MPDGFIDCHTHFWDTERLSYPWQDAGSFPSLPHRHTPADLVAEASTAPTALVHVQAEADHADPVAETRWLAEQRARPESGGLPTALVAYADLSSAEVEETLDEHLDVGPVVGIRQELWWEPVPSRPDILAADLLQDPAWRRGLQAAARRGLSFDVTCFTGQLEQVADMFESIEMWTVIDHLGLPDLDTPASLTAWRAAMRRLARIEHVVVKISGVMQLQGFSSSWSVDAVRPVVHDVLELFGAERCMLGSNYPVDSLGGASYDDVCGALDRLVSDLSTDEQRSLRQETAARTYRLDRTPAPG